MVPYLFFIATVYQYLKKVYQCFLLLQGFCPLTSEATTKEGLDWIIQKLVTICETYPQECELFQNILTEPCFSKDVTQVEKVFWLLNNYINGKFTENKRKQLCKFIGKTVGCSIGFYTGIFFGKHDYDLINVVNFS